MHKLIEPTAQGEGPASTRPRPPAIEPGRDALFLDLDGTLAAIRPHPGDVGPEARRTELMRRLGERLSGRVAVVTGRSLEEADRILDGACGPLAAVHGLVVRGPDGALDAPEASAAVAQAHQALTDFAEGHDGLLVEDKGVSVGLHYRAAPDLQGEAERLGHDLAERHGLSAQPGDMVFELRQPGANKGSAVRRLMALDEFAGARPIFVGDDLTDEDGFAAAQELGGYAVLVGPREPSGADYGLADVEAVFAWLEEAVA